MNAAEIQALLDAKHKERAAAAAQAESATGATISNEPSEIADAPSIHEADEMPLAFVGNEASDDTDIEGVAQEPNADGEIETNPELFTDSTTIDATQSENSDSVESEAPTPNAEPALPATATSTPTWIKACLGLAGCLAIAATTIGLINRNVLQSQLDQLAAFNEDLLQRCRYTETQCDLLMGNPGNADHPFWNNRTHVLDLDREFFAQVPTTVGMVNVLRVRPTSLNERHKLVFEVTNPNVLKLHRGKLIIRTANEPFDSSRRYDYEQLRHWLKTVQSTVYDLGDLAPGETRNISAIVNSNDTEGLRPEDKTQYVDFEVIFDYFSSETQSATPEVLNGT